MKLLPISLTVAPDVVERFKKQAREAFPKETLAYLLGTDAGTNVEVTDLYVPDDQDVLANENSIMVPQHWLEEARQVAKETASVVVGDIHSHPFKATELGKYRPEATPSEADIQCIHFPITGICLVLQQKSRLITRVRFWGPVVQIKVKS